MERPFFLTEQGLKPEDFVSVGYFMMNPPEEAPDMFDQVLYKHLLESPHSQPGQCAHCGQYINHTAVFCHVPTDTIVGIGSTCAFKRMGLSNAGWKAYQHKLQQARKLGRLLDEKLSFIEDNDDFREFLQYVQPELTKGVQQYLERFDAVKPLCYINGFLRSIIGQFQRKGSLSDKQVAAALRVAREQAQRENEEQEEQVEAQPIPPMKGRTTIKATVLAFKEQYNDYGATWKMLVQHDDGWKLWGSMPQTLADAEPGDEVQFDARVEVSRDDPTFGFFSRPTKAEIIKAAILSEEAV